MAMSRASVVKNFAHFKPSKLLDFKYVPAWFGPMDSDNLIVNNIYLLSEIVTHETLQSPWSLWHLRVTLSIPPKSNPANFALVSPNCFSHASIVPASCFDRGVPPCEPGASTNQKNVSNFWRFVPSTTFQVWTSKASKHSGIHSSQFVCHMFGIEIWKFISWNFWTSFFMSIHFVQRRLHAPSLWRSVGRFFYHFLFLCYNLRFLGSLWYAVSPLVLGRLALLIVLIQTFSSLDSLWYFYP